MWHSCWYIFLLMIRTSYQTTSPISPRSNYSHSVELRTNVADLWWTVNETSKEIIFELHVNTTGWIALGISSTGGMTGADIGVGWVDSTGRVFFEDRYASGRITPVLDTTSTDWFALSGREVNGWTAIQFKRALDTCDTMDVAIMSGTNRLIYAYGLVDPIHSSTGGNITYHEDRRGSKIFSLRSYDDPPPVSKFSTFETFEFRLNNYTVPAVDTTYYCKVFKAPSDFKTKRHIIAHQMLISESTHDMVHHLLLYECNPLVSFNDAKLPEGECDSINNQIRLCTMNIAIGWAVGGQTIEEFPPEAGYPIGGDLTVKYYVLQMHYDNPNLTSSRVDNSGLRFFTTENLRPNDLAVLTFGTSAGPESLAIPPGVSNFVVDSYCPVSASQKFPSTGLTIINAFPHTHLQGTQVWTKLIRNGTVIDYLFNAEAYDFNYQMNYRLAKPIQIYPGDAFLTRCVYNTMIREEVTLGGERTRDEMCLNMFSYYPRVDQQYLCISLFPINVWSQFLADETVTWGNLGDKIRNISWTSDLKTKWQTFYNESVRVVFEGTLAGNYTVTRLPQYNDLKANNCTVRTMESMALQLNPSSIIIHLLFAKIVLSFFIFH